jgi:hypothetical protein
MKQLTLFLVLFCSVKVFAEGIKNECGRYMVHYTPLETKLFVPMTEGDIEKRSRCSFEMTSCELDRLFSKKITSEKKIIGGLRAKIKSELSGEIFYLTNLKEVVRNVDSKLELLKDEQAFDLAKTVVSEAAKSCKKSR